METTVLSACNLSNSARWIPLDNLGHQYYRHMCSNCGAIINRQQLPDMCNECKSLMKEQLARCENCRFAIKPYKDPFTGRIEYSCSIAKPIVDNFGDSMAITSNMVTNCEGFEPKEESEGENNE